MRARGRPMRRADVVTTQMTFPANLLVRLTKEAVFETLETTEWRVVGGTMSLSAARRSRRDSSSTGVSDSTEEMEMEEEVREEAGEMYGEGLACGSFSSTMCTLTMV
jgi:hypothetical protein